MNAELYWIGGTRLAILPRPRGGDWLDEEIQSLQQGGIHVLVCLLTREEQVELELREEESLCGAHGIEFVSFPVADRSIPASLPDTLNLVRRLTEVLRAGQAVAVHCRQGIGRAGMIAACVLAAHGAAPEIALERVAQARGCPVPDTAEQRAWVMKIVEQLSAGRSARNVPEKDLLPPWQLQANLDYYRRLWHNYEKGVITGSEVFDALVFHLDERRVAEEISSWPIGLRELAERYLREQRPYRPHGFIIGWTTAEDREKLRMQRQRHYQLLAHALGVSVIWCPERGEFI